MSQRQSAAELGERVDKGHNWLDKPQQNFNAFEKWMRGLADKIGITDKDTMTPYAYKQTTAGFKQEASDQENILKTLSAEDLETFAEMSKSGGDLVDEMAKLPGLTSEMIDAMKGMEESVSDFEGYMERLKAAAADRVRKKKTMEGVNESNKGERKTIRPKK